MATTTISEKLFVYFTFCIGGNPLSKNLEGIAKIGQQAQFLWVTDILKARLPVELWLLAVSEKESDCMQVVKYLEQKRFMIATIENAEQPTLVAYMHGVEVSRLAMQVTTKIDS